MRDSCDYCADERAAYASLRQLKKQYNDVAGLTVDAVVEKLGGCDSSHPLAEKANIILFTHLHHSRDSLPPPGTLGICVDWKTQSECTYVRARNFSRTGSFGYTFLLGGRGGRHNVFCTSMSATVCVLYNKTITATRH